MRQLRADLRRHREADTMYHARNERPSATLRQTLKRHSRSMYEASGCASVRSASSAFSAALQLTATCASCKPALLYSDGCGAAAVHSMCRGSCGQFTLQACATEAPRPTASSATAIPTRASARARCARACVHSCLLLERAHQVAACNMRHETDAMCVQHALCNMQPTTSTLRPSRVSQMTRDLCRTASCSAMGAAQLNCAVVQQAARAVGITPPTHPHRKNQKSTMPRRLRRIG